MDLLNMFVKLSVDDQASGKMDGISSSMIAKGELIASAIKSALSAAVSAIQSVIGGALESFGQFEQLAGGMETFFGSAADSVISNSKRAYDAAGMSANQYMSTVSMFATSLVQSVARSNQQIVQDNSAAVSKALDDAYEAQSRAFQHQLTEAERALDDEYSALSKSLNKQVEAMTKAASQAVSARQKQFDKDNENLSKSLSKELAAVQAEAERIVTARQKQLDEEYSNLSKSLDSQVKEFERATNERLKLMDKEYRERLKQLDAEKAAAIGAVDGQIDAINKQADAEEAARKKSIQSEKLAELQKQLNTAKTRKGREKAQKELNDYLAEIERDRVADERKAQIESLKDQREDIKDHYSELKDQAKEQYDYEKDAYKEQRSEQLAALREANSQQLALMKENQKLVIQQVREEGNARVAAQNEANNKVMQAEKERQQAELEQMREASDEKVAAKREENEEVLKQVKRGQQDQLTAMRESQQDQLAAMKDSIEAQKAALQEAADANSGYVTATAEDQQRAAELADIAVRDMADNANKTGTALEMIQNAYQGFAKQNYTMLDNLKLGYAGTKEGMENLLRDAERVSAGYGDMRDFSIDSFADIVEAIHIMQVEMGISGLSVDELKQKMADNDFTMQELTKLSEAWYGNRDSIDAVKASLEAGGQTLNDFTTLLGTTALEGSTTYEGAINRVKAAWDNWLLSLADPEWNVAESTTTLMEEVGNAAAIIIPRVEEILTTLLTYVAEHAPEIAEKLKNAFMNSLPDEWKAKIREFGQKFNEFMEGAKPVVAFIKGIGDIFATVGTTFYKIGNNIGVVLADFVSGLEGTANVGGTVFYDIGQGIKAVGDFFTNAGRTISDAISKIVKFFGDMKDGAGKAVGGVIDWFKNLPSRIVNAIGDLGNLLWNAGSQIISGLVNGIANNFWTVGDTILGGLNDAVNSALRFLGIASPSKLFKWIGEMSMEGLGSGLEGQMPMIESAMEDVEDLMNINPTIGNVSSAVSAAGMRGLGGENVLNVYVDKMEVRDDKDIYRVSEQLNDLWRREMAGALA